jgi:hyperpolarization activated cyclic nucleotide-gated potassium channel 1
VKILRLLRIAKIIRLLHHGSQIAQVFDNIAQMFADAKVSLHESTIKLFALFAGLCICCHWLGCINFLMCKMYDFPEDSWVVVNNLEHATARQQYMWTFFKALGLMVMQDEQPWAVYNSACEGKVDGWCAVEAWGTLTFIYLGQIFFAVLIGEMSALMMGMNIGKRNYQQQQQRVNEYMRAKKLPIELRSKLREYYAAQSKGKRLYDETEIMKGLSEQLRMEILRHNARGLMAGVPLPPLTPPPSPPLTSLSSSLCIDVPLLHKSPEAFSEAMVLSMQPDVHFTNDTVFEEGSEGLKMYFIYSGIIEISSQYRTESIVTIGDGCYFGDVALLKNCTRTASAKVKTLSIMYTVTRKHLLAAFEHHIKRKGDFGAFTSPTAFHHDKRHGSHGFQDDTDGAPQAHNAKDVGTSIRDNDAQEEMRLFKNAMMRTAEGRYLRMRQFDPQYAEIDVPQEYLTDDQDKETALFRAEDELISQLFGAAASRDRHDPKHYRALTEGIIAKMKAPDDDSLVDEVLAKTPIVTAIEEDAGEAAEDEGKTRPTKAKAASKVHPSASQPAEG